MSNHSPAPWKLERRGYTFIVSKPGEGYITRDICRMDGSTMSAFDQEANARLIATSPKLLAALKELLPGAKAMGWDVTNAESAIAEAEGVKHG